MSAAEVAKSAGYTVDGSGLHAMVRDPDGRIVCIRHRMSGADNEYFMRWIADALTVQEETSKTPRQLADEVERLTSQRDALLAAVRNLDEAYCDVHPDMTREARAFGRKALIAAREAIALAEQQP